MNKKLITATFLAALLLTGCTADKESAPESTPHDSASENTSTAQPDTEPESSVLFTNYALDGMEDISITGEATDPGELSEFEYTTKDLSAYCPDLNEFLEELNIPEITEQSTKAYTLLHFFSTENFSSAAVSENDLSKLPQLDVPSYSPPAPSHFYASGINFDSFINSYLDVFTVNAAERVFAGFPFFCSYNEQLWFADCAMTGDTGAVHEEYELITNSDSEILFRCTVFAAEPGEPTEYDPDKRDSYKTYTLDYKFVKTDNGWRADEFPIFSRALG